MSVPDRFAGQPSVGRYTPAGRSKLAAELVRVKPSIRSRLRLHDYALVLIEGAVSLAEILASDDDRSISERLELIEFEIPDEFGAWLIRELEGLDPDGVEPWFRRFTSPAFSRFLRRLLGASKYESLRRALHADVLVVTAAVKRGTELIQPFIVALEDCMAGLSEQRRRDARLPGRQAERALITTVVQIDKLLASILASPEPFRWPRPGEVVSDPESVQELVSELRAEISVRSSDALRGQSVFLARKLQGARDALEYSADGVSQAANSLIELIDRFTRERFDDTKVLNWVDSQFEDSSDLTYIRDGVRKPTKKAQLLCLAYAGADVGDPSEPALHGIIALGLLAAREVLQRLKHADGGTDEDRLLLLRQLTAVEGALLFLVKVCWRFPPFAQPANVEEPG